jgi:hypothetical protein
MGERQMTLRCKPGDIAMITWDYDDCLENLGCLVEVGRRLSMEDGMYVWRIRPITPELYALREANDSLTRESVTWASRVNHPDAWMVPIRPQQPGADAEETDGLGIPREGKADSVAEHLRADALAGRPSAVAAGRVGEVPDALGGAGHGVAALPG